MQSFPRVEKHRRVKSNLKLILSIKVDSSLPFMKHWYSIMMPTLIIICTFIDIRLKNSTTNNRVRNLFQRLTYPTSKSEKLTVVHPLFLQVVPGLIPPSVSLPEIK